MSPSGVESFRVMRRPFPEPAAGFHLRVADKEQSQEEEKDGPHAADDGSRLSWCLEERMFGEY